MYMTKPRQGKVMQIVTQRTDEGSNRGADFRAGGVGDTQSVNRESSATGCVTDQPIYDVSKPVPSVRDVELQILELQNWLCISI